LADKLKLESTWTTYKQFSLSFFKIHKETGNFYDKAIERFNLRNYPCFRKYFPEKEIISARDLKLYLSDKKQKQ